MRDRLMVTGIAALLCSTLSYPQQGLVGTYTGTYREKSYPRPMPQEVTLQITSAESGKLGGKYKLERGECRGDYVIEGTYQDDKIDIRTTNGPIRGCGDEPVTLTVQSNKLVGTIGSYAIELLRK